jgi:hypothetical protein
MSKKAVVAVAVALVFVVLAPVVIAAEGAVGEWEFKSQMQARTLNATMTISKNAEGKYEGKWSAQRGENTLSDIKFDNGKISFVQTSSFGGPEMKTTYEGTVEGSKIKGTGKGQFGELTFEGTLQGAGSTSSPQEPKSGADAIVGEWQITTNMPAREMVDKLIISKNADGMLAGKWVGQRGENPITNLKFEGGKLTFTRTSSFGGREMQSTYEGTVEGDMIKGKFTSERGDREANATRVGASKPEAGKAEPNKPASPAKRSEPAPSKAEPNKPN